MPASRSPADPPRSMLTIATPSESKSLKARRTRSAGSSIPAIASATSASSPSVGRICPEESWSLIPSCARASRASPVPCAASAARRVKRWSAMSTVVVETRASSPA